MSTDRQMLEKCLEAFVAVQGADSARRFLKKLGLQVPYGLPRKRILASHMTQDLLKHLQTKEH
jgi:hypothetical protein